MRLRVSDIRNPKVVSRARVGVARSWPARLTGWGMDNLVGYIIHGWRCGAGGVLKGLKYTATFASYPGQILVLEPDPSHGGGRKGSGHHLTFELSPGQNVDLTNQKR